MNVIITRITAARMLSALTMKVLTTALANLDTLGQGLSAKVIHN